METEPAYLEALDRQLLDQPEAMLVSQLDGFLTGIVVSPDLITPGRWIPLIWAGDEGNGEPDFESEEELQTFLNLVMTHYHAIIDALAHPGAYAPVLETDTRTDETLWEMWIDGFAQAMALSPDGWARIDGDDDAGCHAALKGIRTLRDFAEGNLALGEQEEDRWDAEAPDLIPIWVEMLHQWRVENDPHRPVAVRRTKVGRNDRCPCGSGKKYKKCCGTH
ncbi:MAG: YecA family protein [Sphingobium sp.]|uniref:UPF0149 family protein n=1 Tax=Sphingomonas melonis TaxID=152682 RepID=UPI00037D926C|nr:UPF0149 family protein [Sphingomonas melonis]MBS49509.1 YecA family protein [Sphingobium sp.]|tara:strand:+ start:48 stop:710 length:663 start_codon:yes stop_codon:yes gene_type:complete